MLLVTHLHHWLSASDCPVCTNICNGQQYSFPGVQTRWVAAQQCTLCYAGWLNEVLPRWVERFAWAQMISAAVARWLGYMCCWESALTGPGHPGVWILITWADIAFSNDTKRALQCSKADSNFVPSLTVFVQSDRLKQIGCLRTMITSRRYWQGFGTTLKQYRKTQEMQ